MSVTSPGTADVRKQLAELRHRLKEQRDFSAELRLEAVRDPSGSATERLARSRNAEDVISAQIEDLRARESEELSALSRNGYGAVGMDGLGMDVTTRLHDPIVHADLAKIGRSVTRLGDPYRLAEIPAQDVMPWLARNLASSPTGTVTPTPGMGSVPLTTVIPLPVPEPTFLSVIPTQVLEAPSQLFAQRIRSAGGGTAPVAPGQIKPAVDFQYVDSEATPETIAGYTKVNKQLLADVLGLEPQIQIDLTDDLRLRLESEVLSGDGTVSNWPGKQGIVGLLNTTGVASIPTTEAKLLDAIRSAKTAVRTVGGIPRFVALNETDAEAIDIAKSTGSGEYISSPYLMPAPPTIWGLTMVPGMGVPPGTAVVGDPRGFALLMHENAAIYVSQNDQDDFIRNRYTLLVECQAALAVYVPSFFAVVEVS